MQDEKVVVFFQLQLTSPTVDILNCHLQLTSLSCIWNFVWKVKLKFNVLTLLAPKQRLDMMESVCFWNSFQCGARWGGRWGELGDHTLSSYLISFQTHHLSHFFSTQRPYLSYRSLPPATPPPPGQIACLLKEFWIGKEGREVGKVATSFGEWIKRKNDVLFIFFFWFFLFGPRVTPASELRDHLLGEPSGVLGIEHKMPCSRQASYPLYYHSILGRGLFPPGLLGCTCCPFLNPNCQRCPSWNAPGRTARFHCNKGKKVLQFHVEFNHQPSN